MDLDDSKTRNQVYNNPYFRGLTFPVHFIQNLREYRFFIFIIEADFEGHKKFLEIDCIENIIPLKFEIDSLIRGCDKIIEKYGELSNIIYPSEESVQLCGMLRKHYGMSSDNLDRFIDKNLMVQKLNAAGIRAPKGVLFDDKKYQLKEKEYLLEIENVLRQYPFFIKPTAQCGSVDTCMVKNRGELKKWIEQKADYAYLIQEYIEGKFFHCETFIKNGKIMRSSVFEYSCPGFFFSMGYPVGSISLPVSDPYVKRISEFTKDVLQGLGILENGVTQVEIFLNQENELVFLEAAARPPGLLGDFLYQKYLNMSIVETHLLLQLGEYSYDDSKFKIYNYTARYAFPFPSTGCITKLSNKIKIDSEFTEDLTRKVGDEVKKSIDLFNIASFMILWNKDYFKLKKDFQALMDYTPFEIQDEINAEN